MISEKAMRSAAKELNEVLFDKPEIDVKAPLADLTKTMEEAIDLIDPTQDEFSEATQEVIDALVAAKKKGGKKKPVVEDEDEDDAPEPEEEEEEKPKSKKKPTPVEEEEDEEEEAPKKKGAKKEVEEKPKKKLAPGQFGKKGEESFVAMAIRLLEEEASEKAILAAFSKAYKERKDISDVDFVKKRIVTYMDIAKKKAK